MKLKKTIKTWSKSRNIVILTLIFVYPFGVYLMWKGAHFNRDLRWAITLIMVIWTLVLGNSGQSGSDYDDCGATFTQNGCTYYRDSSCQVISQSCD